MWEPQLSGSTLENAAQGGVVEYRSTELQAQFTVRSWSNKYKSVYCSIQSVHRTKTTQYTVPNSKVSQNSFRTDFSLYPVKTHDLSSMGNYTSVSTQNPKGFMRFDCYFFQLSIEIFFSLFSAIFVWQWRSILVLHKRILSHQTVVQWWVKRLHLKGI